MVEEEGYSPKQVFNFGKTGTSFPLTRITFGYTRSFINYVTLNIKSTVLHYIFSFIYNQVYTSIYITFISPLFKRMLWGEESLRNVTYLFLKFLTLNVDPLNTVL
jgi:hypothetical protein